MIFPNCAPCFGSHFENFGNPSITVNFFMKAQKLLNARNKNQWQQIDFLAGYVVLPWSELKIWADVRIDAIYAG